MVKSEETVIQYVYLTKCPINSPKVTNSFLLSAREFNELVNMSASELEEWLQSEDSQSSGWSKDDSSGETIGHER